MLVSLKVFGDTPIEERTEVQVVPHINRQPRERLSSEQMDYDEVPRGRRGDGDVSTLEEGSSQGVGLVGTTSRHP